MIWSHCVHSKDCLCFNKDSLANKEIKISKVILLLMEKKKNFKKELLVVC